MIGWSLGSIDHLEIGKSSYVRDVTSSMMNSHVCISFFFLNFFFFLFRVNNCFDLALVEIEANSLCIYHASGMFLGNSIFSLCSNVAAPIYLNGSI
jgi:hypothetical protein